MLVIGDSCDDRTGEVCREAGDPRIRFVNLPERFGEQSGPNSIGMRLARGRYVALLNQDDVWLSGHLEAAVTALAGSDAGFFLGRTVRAGKVASDSTWGSLPHFTRSHPPTRAPAEGFSNAFAVEPASAWVFDRSLVGRVGDWSPARFLHRPPIQDWYLRAWRSGACIVFGEEVSVLKVTTQYSRDSVAPAYDIASPEHQNLERWIAATPVDEVRAVVVAGTAIGQSKRARVVEELAARGPLRGLLWLAAEVGGKAGRMATQNRLAAALFRSTGIDLYTAAMRALRRSPGRTFDYSSRRRTGKPLPDPPDLDQLMAVIDHSRGSADGD